MFSMKKICKSNHRSKYSPCYKCPDRIPGCHGSCQSYICWKEFRNTENLKELLGRHEQNNLRGIEVKRTLAKKKRMEGK